MSERVLNALHKNPLRYVPTCNSFDTIRYKKRGGGGNYEIFAALTEK